MNLRSYASGYAYSRFARVVASLHQQSDSQFARAANIAELLRPVSKGNDQIDAVNFGAASQENYTKVNRRIHANQAQTENGHHPHVQPNRLRYDPWQHTKQCVAKSLPNVYMGII